MDYFERKRFLRRRLREMNRLAAAGAIPTASITSVYGPLPGDEEVASPGHLGMLYEGVKEGLIGPYAGLAENLGLLKEGTHDDMREGFEEARLAYLAENPSAFRATLAGAAEMVPPIILGGAIGKTAAFAGRMLGSSPAKAKLISKLVGGAEGVLSGWGETAGRDPKQQVFGALLGGVLGAAVPAAAQAEKASSLAKWLDTPEGARADAVKLWRELMTAPGKVPRAIFEASEEAKGAIKVHKYRVNNVIRKMEEDVSAHLVANPGVDVDKLWKEIDVALSTDTIHLLPGELQATAKIAREQVDSLSQELVDLSRAQRAKTGRGLLSKKLEETYEANKGRYIHRSREAWDNPDFRSNYLNEDGTWKKEWHDYIERYMEDSGADRETATGVFIDALNHATLDADVRNVPSARIISPADLHTRLQKKGGAESLREMLGEYTDPRVNLKKSILFVAHDLEMNKLFYQVEEMLVESGLARRQKMADEVFKYQMPASKRYGALAGRGRVRSDRLRVEGLYFKDLDLVHAMTETREAAKAGIFGAVSGFTRYMHTVGSLVTQVRNAGSGNMMLALQGHIPNPFNRLGWQTVLGLGKVSPAKLMFGVDADAKTVGRLYEEAYEALLSRNIVSQSTAVGDIKAYFRQAERFFEGGKFKKTKDAMKWVEGWATKFYQGSDDYWKLQLFMKERDRYIGIGIDKVTSSRMAGDVVRDTMQVYSRVPRAIQAIRDFPLTGPFLSFPAEIVRNMKNTIERGLAEMGYKVPLYDFSHLTAAQQAALKGIGRKRLLSAGATLAAPIALAKASQSLWGMNDDAVNAMRESAVAPWSESSDLFIWNKDDESHTISFIDLSFMNPYGYVMKQAKPASDVLKTIVSFVGGRAPDSHGMQQLLAVLEEGAAPATQPEIWASELYRGVQALGKMKGAPFDEKAKEVMYRIWRAGAPGTALSLERFVRSLDMPGVREVMPATTKYGQRFIPWQEAASMLLGLRVSQSDLLRGMQFKGQEYYSARSLAKRFYTDEARNKSDRSMYRLLEARQTGDQTNQQAGEELLRHVANMRTLGLDNQTIIRQLNSGGIGKSDAISLVYYGKVPKMRWKD